MLRWFAIGVAVLAACWSAAWYAGRSMMQDAFAAQTETLREEGATVRHGALSIDGFPFAYQGNLENIDIALPVPGGGESASRPADYRWRAPWVRASIAASAPQTLIADLPPEQELLIVPRDPEAGRYFDALPLEIRLLSDGLRVTSSPSGDLIDSGATARRLQLLATLGPPERPAASADISGVDVSASASLPSDRKAAGVPGKGDFDAADLTALLRIRPPGQPFPRSMAIQAAQLSGAYEVTSAEARGFSLNMEGPAAVLDGVEELSLTAANARVDGRVSPSDLAGKSLLTLDAALKDVTLGAAVWTNFDPSGALDRTIPELLISAEGRVPAGMTLDDLLTGRALLGLDMLDIRQLSATGLGLDLRINGRLEAVQNVVGGTLDIEIGGISGFLTQAVRAGLVPPQQALIARLMVQNLSRPGRSEDHSRFEIVLRDGVSYVNGTAVGPAPSLP